MIADEFRLRNDEKKSHADSHQRKFSIRLSWRSALLTKRKRLSKRAGRDFVGRLSSPRIRASVGQRDLGIILAKLLGGRVGENKKES
ncbi:MAG: hypothetical protein ACM37Z_11590, partial [Deltaproteobacteria bacterium]